MKSKRQKRVSYDADGEVHEFTFSTYRRQPLLTPDPDVCRLFLKKLDAARRKHGFLDWAYVLMPEHVHPVIPARTVKLANILESIKQPVTQNPVARWKRDDPARLNLPRSGTIRGRSPFSFWQVGGGYDRNPHGPKEYWDAIQYVHLNPVRRGLVEKPEAWPWSSSRFYLDLPPVEFEVDRCEEWIP